MTKPISSPPPKPPSSLSVSQPATITPSKTETAQQTSSTPPAPPPPPKPLTQSDKGLRHGTMKARGSALRGSLDSQLSNPSLDPRRQAFAQKGPQKGVTELRPGIGEATTQDGMVGAASVGGKGIGELKADPKVAKDMDLIRKEVPKEIELLEQHPKLAADADLREELSRMKGLKSTMETEPGKIEQAIAENRKDPAYKHMGPTKFASQFVAMDQRIKDQKLPDHGMTSMEKAALWGYTGKDYFNLNVGLRGNDGKIPDKGMSAYAQHVKSAMSKFPDYTPSGKESEPKPFYRSLYPPPMTADKSVQKRFQSLSFEEGGTYRDHGFASHSVDKTVHTGGTWKLHVDGYKNAKNISPYSAHWKPTGGEGELLVIPGTEYDIKKVAGADIYLTPK